MTHFWDDQCLPFLSDFSIPFISYGEQSVFSESTETQSRLKVLGLFLDTLTIGLKICSFYIIPWKIVTPGGKVNFDSRGIFWTSLIEGL